MDGGFNKVPNCRTVIYVNGQPMVLITVLSIHLMGGGMIYHDKKFPTSFNVRSSKELLTPLNGQVYQPV
jgi:hypothetical protein